MQYEEFLELKRITPIISGFDVDADSLNENLFDFQRVIVKWALKRGRAAIFADTGLGKTLMQTSWAQSVVDHTDGDVLIVAPLCVAQQTVREGIKFGINIHYCRTHEDAKQGINITNYEMLDRFNLDEFHGVVLDESSIIKNRDGKTRNAIISACQSVPYRLSCTATPSPNDFMELGNQSEFLGIMSMVEMLAMFFINDAGDTGTWILKGHGKAKFWEWLSTWACVLRSPTDLGFDGSAYVLPPLEMFDHVVESKTTDGLFADIATGLMERNAARKESIDDRVAKCAEIVNASTDQWVIWCHRNEEAEKLTKLIPGAVDVAGSNSMDEKEKSVYGFIDGSIRVIVSKPKVLGSGMNFQHCHNTAFVGLSDSWEQFYQAIRRFYRFGQTHSVNCHVISAESEGAVVANIKRKEEQNATMGAEMVKFMSDSMKKQIFGAAQEKAEYVRHVTQTTDWTIHNADCIDLAKEIPDESIDFTIYSPPFESLFTYSNSDRDMGNNKSSESFRIHYQFLIDQNFRMMKLGRLVVVHCMNLTTSKANDGFIGIRDFRGDIIRAHQKAGFIYHSEVCIWKDPVVAMQRTKALGLLHKTIKKDSSMSRQGLADYLVIFRKPGQNEKFISHNAEEFPVQMWQKYASPVWFDIDQSRTLNFRDAREEDDVKHICPLQLDVIERAMNLWTAPDDLVFSPFTGVGSEGYTAVKMGRRFIGSELKPSYYDQAIKNMASAKSQNLDLFSDE
jgi:DNA modification methylase/superfamily II DNA or RNA helicase